MVEQRLSRSEFLVGTAALLKRDMNLNKCIFLCPDQPSSYAFQSSPRLKFLYRDWVKKPNNLLEKAAVQFMREEDEIKYEDHDCFLKIKAGTQLLGIMILPFRKEVDYVYMATILGSIMLLRRMHHALKERIKELTCLYQLNEIIQKDQHLDLMLENLVHMIPAAFQYPEIAGCSITIKGVSSRSFHFFPDVMLLSTQVNTLDESWGEIQVSYSSDHIGLEKVSYLEEEVKLLELIAQKLSQYMDGKAARDAEKRMLEQLRHADRLATLGTLTAGIAHEINEPLANILGFAQLAQKSIYDPLKVKGDMEKIVKSSLHAREIVKKLLFFSRQMPININQVNLNNVLDEGLYFLEYRCARENIKIHKDFAPNLPFIDADQGQLMQVVVNLTVNAIQAMENGGELFLRTWYDKEFAFLSIRDTGQGMNKDIQKKMFLPFFTTKPIGLGTGLGLAVVHGILKSHNAKIDVRSTPNKGTEFIIGFPVSAK